MNGSLMDYDGDGDAKEGVAGEFAGLQEKLLTAIKAYAKEVAKADIGYDAATYPYFFADENANGKLDEGEKRLHDLDPAPAEGRLQLPGRGQGSGRLRAQREVRHPVDARLDRGPEHQDRQAGRHRRRPSGTTPATSTAPSMAFRDWDAEGEVPAQLRQVPLRHRPARVHRERRHGRCDRAAARSQTVGTTAAEPANGFACTTCHNDLTKYTAVPGHGRAVPERQDRHLQHEKDDKGNLQDPVAANLCLECHQGRHRRQAVNLRLGNAEDDKVPEKGLSFINVHYFAAGASLFGNDAQGAYQYAGKEYAGRYMHPAPFDNCTGCHNTHELGLQTSTSA